MFTLKRVPFSLCNPFAKVHNRNGIYNLNYLIKTFKKRGLSSNYWSSTTYVGDTTNAWNVNFNNGNDNINNKTNSNYVRCVRGGL